LLIAGLTCLHALDPQLDHVAHGLLERRPVFDLIRREFETCLQRGDACVGEGGDVGGAPVMLVFGARTAVAVTTVTAKTLLRIHIRSTGKREERRRGNDWLEHYDPPQIFGEKNNEPSNQ
jgi:hypothetical protein